MGKNIRSKKLWVSSAFSFLIVLSSVNAFAWDSDRNNGHDRDRGDARHREVVVVDRHSYSYHDGRFFRPGLFGLEIALLTPPLGAVVTYIPSGHRTVWAGGVSYYYYNNVYYRPAPSGYVVVPAPALSTVSNVVALPAVSVSYAGAPAAGSVTINVPNSNGSYTPVTLVRRGSGYVGPQGEYYPEHPTVDQLRALYAR